MESHLKRAKFIALNIVKYYSSLSIDIFITHVKIITHMKRYVFRITLLPGTRVHLIFSYAPDIQAALKLYLFYPFKTGTDIFIAVSEFDNRENNLLNMLNSQEFSNSKFQIPIALGYDFMGDFYFVDLARLLHLLVIGPSGTGKSVALQCIVLSIITKCSVESVRLILFDIGANSLSCFSSEKHLYAPIVKDTGTGITVLESLVAEMDRRLSLPEQKCYDFPYCICIIDEFDDTIGSLENKVDSRRFISSINSIIRRGRKAKVILILASHDSTLKNTRVNVSGIISRIAFQCASHYNSLAALGTTGAQNLPGNGAMLFKSQDECSPIPLQGAFVEPAQIERVLNSESSRNNDIDMLEIKETQVPGNLPLSCASADKGKKELADILLWTIGHTTVSMLRLKHKFRLGNRVSEIVDILYEMKIVGEKFSKQLRQVIPTCLNDMSSEAINLLKLYGHTEAEIAEQFERRK